MAIPKIVSRPPWQLGPWIASKKKEEHPYPDSLPTIKAVYFTGSRFICNPPVMDTDDDRIVLVDHLPCPKFMKKSGFELDGDEQYPPGYFQSWRKDTKNLIFTTDKNFYLQFVAATLLAKELNLTNKEQRCALFDEITGALGTGDIREYTGPLPDKGML